MQIPFWVDVDTVDNDADMQMISGYIAGSTNLGNGVVLVHRIANLRQKLAAMGIERTIPTAMIDDQIISVADMIPRFDDCASLHRKNRRAVGIGNVQTIVVGGILAGNTDILAFAKERSDVLLPVWVIERIAEPAAGGRRIIINKRIVDLPQNRNAFTFFYFVEIDGQVMRIYCSLNAIAKRRSERLPTYFSTNSLYSIEPSKVSTASIISTREDKFLMLKFDS